MDIALALRSQMLATLMAALDVAKVATAATPGGASPPGTVVTGQLASLDAGGAAMLMVKGQPLAVNFGPHSMAEAMLAFKSGTPLSLRMEENTANGQVRASIVQGSAVQAVAAQGNGAGILPLQTVASADQELAALRTALAQTVTRAGAQQQEMGPLMANLAALVAPGTPSQIAAQAMVTEPVMDAALTLLGLRYDPEQAGQMQPGSAGAAAALRSAVATSGIGHEARLASGEPADLALAAGDLKSALSLLKAALAEMRGSQPMPADHSQNGPAPLRAPPHRDAMPAGQPPSEPEIEALGRTRAELASTLSQQADGALERVRLLQAASLPPELRPAHDPAQAQRWLMELPMLVDGRTQMLPLRIEREPERRSLTMRDAATWRVRFALDGEPLGAIHAIVTWRMRQLGISIWAEREATRQVLNQTAPELRQALADASLDHEALGHEALGKSTLGKSTFGHAVFENIEIDIHAGRPTQPKPATGLLLDKHS